MDGQTRPAGQVRWDHEVDVVVVGSGAGGMVSAITAQHHGLEVLMVEKTDRIGGSTAVSGGAMWLPLNDWAGAAGHQDDYARVWTYLQETVGDKAPEAMRRAFLDAGAKALRFLTQHTELRVAARVLSPDYYPDRSGAAQGGRAVDTLPFDGRLLGRHFRELREPISQFTVLGGMMVNITDVNHLLALTRSFASWRHGMGLILRYAADRLRGYPRGTRLLLGNALAARLFKSVLDRRIAYWLEAPALRLLTEGFEDGSGARAVVGVVVQRDGREVNVRARRGVVIASGGFSWNPALREGRYPEPWPGHSMAPRGNAGEGVQMAQGAGAVLGKTTGAAFWIPVSVHRKPDGTQVVFPHLVWDRAKPGLLAVNVSGQRFVNESDSYHDFVRGMYRANQSVPSIPAVLVCDADFMQRWGLGLAMPGGRPREHLVRDGYLLRADTLEELGRQAGVDGAALAQTVARFNGFAETGTDPEFGKGSTTYNRALGDASHRPNPCLGPVRRAPFYAVRVYPGDVGTCCGIEVDTHARALDAEGRALPGLYVVGNDMLSIAGGEYPAPGIALGPTVTFGWLAGLHLAGQSPPTS